MIGIVFSNNLNTCPYIDKYIDVFNGLELDYEIIIWNRDNIKKVFPSNFRVYDVPSDIHKERWKKVSDFYGFYRFLNRTIKERKYDKLVLLTTFTALLCFGLIQKKYRKKYIFDFRDLGFEKNEFYKRIVMKIIEHSYFTCMSSPAFAEVFGIENYVMAHNFRYKDINEGKDFQINNRKKNDKIVLLHLGISRGEGYNKRLADVFGNDSRFEVLIVGSGNDTLQFKNYIKDLTNINVKGTYNNEDKVSLIAKADMLLYYYPCDFNCNRALANKYYDCLIFKKPLIGNINTYSGQRLKEKGLGIALDLSSNTFADDVFEYYNKLNIEVFKDSIQKELHEVVQEDTFYLKKIEEFAIE